MTIPAVRLHIHIIMAVVAKLFFVRMAMHASILEAHVVAFSVEPNINPVAIANYRISPVVQQLHMLGFHILLALNALFHRHLLNNGSVDFRFRLRNIRSHAMEKRERNYCDKDKKSRYYFPAIIHSRLPPRCLLFREGVRAVYRGSSLFRPS